MIKKTLRALRQLNATKEMMRKAKADKPTNSNKWWKSEIKYPYKYGVYLRAQHLKGFLKVAVYATEWMRQGISTPCYEIFIDHENEQFITRRLDKTYTETGWTRAMIDNLKNVEDVKLAKYWYDGLLSGGAEDPWMDEHQAAYIKKTLQTNKSGYAAIVEYQRKCRQQDLAEMRRRETAPWDDDMARVPEEPKAFKRWVFHEAVSENYMIYTYSKTGAKEGWCTYCERTVQLKEKPLHGKIGICPRCKREITYKSSGKINTLATDWYKVQLVQNIDGGIVVRHFEAKKCWKGTINAELYLREDTRTLIMGGTKWQYSWELYKNIEHRWCRSDYRDYGNWQRGRIYTGNMYHLSKTGLVHSSLPAVLNHNKKLTNAVADWLDAERYDPNIERCAKAGLYRLAGELAKNNGLIKDRRATELTKALGIDRMRLSRLVAHDGGSLYLSYLQREKVDNTIYPDDILLDLVEKHITLSYLKNMLDHMTLVKAYNYLVRQSDQSDKNPMSQVLTTYNDYMNMAERLKMDTSSEQIYKPKDLKKAHTKVIDLLSQAGWEKTAQDASKKFPKVNEELPRLLKYEYKGSAYQIVAPRTITDIVREGSLLGHCIHTCDFYYQRIETKESFIMFLRKNDDPEKPWYTLEVEPSGNIRQKRTVGDNQNDDLKAAVPFLHEWQQWLQKILSEEDKKLAKISEKKRKENYKKIREEKKKVWHGKLQGQLLADVLEADFLGLEEIC
ncbi:putative uncharacterized protein [Coprococcus eutactus CAG:665]|jgi:hypothetical protein|nr:putative uncharacterized protein [Coprococcus eutactus CAG:665]